MGRVIAAVLMLSMQLSAAQYHIWIFSGQSNMSGVGGVNGSGLNEGALYSQLSPVAGFNQTSANGWLGRAFYSLDTDQTYTTAALSVPNLLWVAWNDSRQRGFCPPDGNPDGPYDAWGTGTIGVGPGYTGCSFVTTQTTTYFGPEMSFLVKHVAANPGQYVAVIKQADGGLGIRNWVPFDASTNPFGGAEWTKLTTMISQATARLTAAGHTYVWEGMVWSQGETDRLSSPSTYLSQTRTFFANVRALTRSDLPIVVARMSDVMLAEPIAGAQGSTDYNKIVAIRAAQADLGNDQYNTWWDRDGEPGCCGTDLTLYYHTNGPGYIADGERAYKAFNHPAFPMPGAGIRPHR